MTHLRSGRWKTALFALAALFAASACLTLTPGSRASTPTAPANAPTALANTPASSAGTPPAAASTAIAPASTPLAAASTPPAAASTPATPAGSPTPIGPSVSVEGNVVSGSGTFTLTDPAVGLAGLPSYAATLKLSFAGTQDAKAIQWSRTYVMLSAQQPAARQLTIEKTGTNADPNPVYLAEVNGASYERHGTDDCNAAVVDPKNSPLTPEEPASFLTGVVGAEAAGSDTVNGLAADHYTFDEHALELSGIVTGTGELWVASQGGYVVKYVLKAQSDENYFGDGLAGSLTLDYELTGVGQPITLQLPPDCPAGLVDAPQLPDASNVQNLPGALTYDTATSLAGASAFYQKQLPGLGWTVLDAPGISDSSVFLDYTKGSQTLTIVVTAGQGGTKVNIALDNSQP